MGGSQAVGAPSISQASRDHGWGERLQLAVRSTLRVSQRSFWAASGQDFACKSEGGRALLPQRPACLSFVSCYRHS